jgi:hypothetical protein
MDRYRAGLAGGIKVGWPAAYVEVAPDWDEAAQPAPDFEVDQRINQLVSNGDSGFVRRCGAGLRVAPPKTVHTDKSRATDPEQVLRQAQPEGL